MGHSGLVQATLSRRGDVYDFYQPQTPAASDGPVATLITERTPEEELY
jgi:hypothetical protein